MTAPTPPQIIVVFGASGDLSRRKIFPALYNLARSGQLPESAAIVGFARDDWDDEGFRRHVRRAVEEFSRTPVDEDVWKRFADLLFYRSGTLDTVGSLRPLDEFLGRLDRVRGTGGRRLYYCATPASVFPDLLARLGECGSQAGNRIVVEKPFGRDLASARELNRHLQAVFEESQVFRIDHFLGKETIQNLLVLRFANTMIERVWNRDNIDHVQITAAESVGIGSRGAFYEETGAVRDMVQNHLLQLLAFVAMEPPRSLDPDAIRDETVRVLRDLRPFRPEDTVRGQYTGYRDEPGVASESTVETFVAVRAHIDNWRWAGVPFLLQTGKHLPRKTTEVAVTFKSVPAALFEGLSPPPPNLLCVRIQPGEGLSFAFQAKPPGLGFAARTVAMDFSYRQWFEGPAEAYERLLHDAMAGDPMLFIRQDAVERAWEVVTPLLEDPRPLQGCPAGSWSDYPAGSWNQAAADLIAPRRWLVEDGGPAVRLGQIMTRDVVTVAPDATVAEVADAMAQRRLGSTLVLRNAQLIGILTERDVLRAAASGTDLTAATASEWMTPDPATAAEDMDAEEAAMLMADRGVRHLPVLAGDRVAGIVSLRDVLNARVRARHPDDPAAAGDLEGRT